MITISQLPYDPSTAVSFFNSLKNGFAAAGFPIVHFEHTSSTPYYLVYQFETNLFLSFELVSTSNNRTKYRMYESWDSVSKTGLGDIYNKIENSYSASITNANITAIADDDGNFGFISINSGTISYGIFGFIKLVNPFANYPIDYPLYFTIDRLSAQGGNVGFDHSGSGVSTFTNIKKYGAADYPDKLSDYDFNKNVVDSSGKMSLTSPLILRSGGLAVGTSSDKLAYCPFLSAIIGTKLIVNQGVEEWIYLGSGIAVREI